jgi:hypothetical protein
MGTLAVAAFGLPSALRTARADDWQQCMAHQPDQVLAACSAVIDQGNRPGIVPRPRDPRRVVSAAQPQ